MKDFITVAVFDYPHEITILKHHLNLSGANYFFENEATISIMPMYSVAIGGIKLKVHLDHVAAVQEILTQLNYGDHLRIV